MGRLRKNSTDVTQLSMQELMRKVVDSFGSKYDDRDPVDEDHASLRDVSVECRITMLKARKILITEGMYSTITSRNVQKLIDSGKNIPEVMKVTGLSRASVHSYIPYKKVIYNLPERSVSADRMKRFRERKKLCEEFVDELGGLSREEAEERLWEVLIILQGCSFTTLKGHRFRYTIKDEEIFIKDQRDSISKNIVFQAFRKVMDLQGKGCGSKRLGTPTAPYLWAIFLRIGIIKDE